MKIYILHFVNLHFFFYYVHKKWNDFFYLIFFILNFRFINKCYEIINSIECFKRYLSFSLTFFYSFFFFFLPFRPLLFTSKLINLASLLMIRIVLIKKQFEKSLVRSLSRFNQKKKRLHESFFRDRI